MELRSCSHFHYIHAIKGGLVTKVLNINSRGKPAVVFKKLADIYGSIDEKAQKSLPARRSREGLEENIPDRCEFKVGSSQVLYAERKLFKDEPEASDADSGGDTDGQQSDVEVDSMTIKQIMEGCKKRKLRQSRSVDSSKEKLRTCSSQELNQSCLLSDEDDSDLNVALSLWKSKLSKRKKLKTKCKGSRISTSSQCGQIIGNIEPINSDHDLLPFSSDLPIPVDIKVETPEIDATEIQNTNYISDELPLLCDENISSCLSSEPIGAAELFYNRGLTTSKKETQYCVLNSACQEYFEGDDPEPLQMEGESSTEWTNKDNLDIHKSHYSDFPATESMEAQYAPSCVSNDSMPEAISSTEERCSDTCISLGESFTHEAICQINNEDMPEAISLNKEQCSDTYISQGKSFTQETICQNNSGVFTHLHGMTNLNSPQLPEMSPGAEVCLTENGYEDKLAFDHEKSTSTATISDCNLSPDYGKSISTRPTSDCNLRPDQHLISIDECPAKEIQSQISDYSDSERNTSPDFHLDDSMDKFNQFEEPKHHPTRLLSTRTTISPTSQERLSKAMKSMRLHDKECKTWGAKPYIKKIKYKVGTAEECDQMRRVESNTYNEQNIRKSKKRSLHSTSTTKVPCVSTRSTAAVQSCSDSAIAFTQRQMQDIECVALKLTNQLKSMKAIVEDRLHDEGNKAASFKFNMDEVRTAIADATKVEASARKWLSMMSRDCNRFCKIMKTTENASTTTQSVIHKAKRKITFADEAGGKLCEVRLIEDDVESFVETIPENYEMVK